MVNVKQVLSFPGRTVFSVLNFLHFRSTCGISGLPAWSNSEKMVQPQKEKNTNEEKRHEKNTNEKGLVHTVTRARTFRFASVHTWAGLCGLNLEKGQTCKRGDKKRHKIACQHSNWTIVNGFKGKTLRVVVALRTNLQP